jgi:hypothetical protein
MALIGGVVEQAMADGVRDPRPTTSVGTRTP